MPSGFNISTYFNYILCLITSRNTKYGMIHEKYLLVIIFLLLNIIFINFARTFTGIGSTLPKKKR